MNVYGVRFDTDRLFGDGWPFEDSSSPGDAGGGADSRSTSAIRCAGADELWKLVGRF